MHNNLGHFLFLKKSDLDLDQDPDSEVLKSQIQICSIILDYKYCTVQLIPSLHVPVQFVPALFIPVILS